MMVNTSELIGEALDWATGIAVSVEMFTDGGGVIRHGALAKRWNPSSSWSDCGPLMDSCNVDVQRYDYEQQPFTFAGVVHDSSEGGWQHIKEYGPTRMIAICRAIVAAFIGDTVEVPDELIGGEV